MSTHDTPSSDAENAQSTSDQETLSRSFFSRLGFDRFSALYVIVLFFVFFGITEDSFLMWNGSIEFVLTDKVIVLMLALAFLVPLTTETFDLSIGANLALGLLIVNKFAEQTDLPNGVGAIVGILACLAIGWINGFIVVKLKVNSFIATLGMSQVVAAIIRNIHDGGQINGAVTDSYRGFGRDKIFTFDWPGTGSEIGLPWYFLYGLIITVGIWYVLEHTPTGRKMFATGGNPEAARLSGINTDRLIWGSLVASGGIAGFAGLVYSWKFGIYTTTVGPPYLFPAVAAVFFGASQFSRRYNVWGTVLAVYTLAFGIKGIGLRYPREISWIQPMFEGLTLLIAVAIASRQLIIKVKKRKGQEDGVTDGNEVIPPAITTTSPPEES